MPKGLEVNVVLWHLEDRKSFSSKHARLWMRGDVTNVNGAKRERKKFNDAGQLLTILGKWNAEKYRALRQKSEMKLSLPLLGVA